MYLDLYYLVIFCYLLSAVVAVSLVLVDLFKVMGVLLLHAVFQLIREAVTKFSLWTDSTFYVASVKT